MTEVCRALRILLVGAEIKCLFMKKIKTLLSRDYMESLLTREDLSIRPNKAS